MERVLVLDSATKLTDEAAEAVVVCGSHGGLYPAWLAAQAGVRASWGETFASYTHHNVLASPRLLEAMKNRMGQGGPQRISATSATAGDNE